MTYSIRRDPGIHLREIVVVIPAHNERRLLAYWRVVGFGRCTSVRTSTW
jgi:hypothetical protein